MENITDIKIEKDDDIIFITCGKYKLFLSQGEKGIDAYCLYSHLMFTARLQETNQVKATNQYLMNGLHWGKDRLQNAKKLLLSMGLIEEVQGHKPDGTFGNRYIRIKTSTNPAPVASEPDSGENDRRAQPVNALTNNINALTKKKNKGDKKEPKKEFIPPTEQEVKDYVSLRKLNVDPVLFYNFFTDGNWIDSRGHPVKNWKQKILTWNSHAQSRARPVKTYEDELNERYGK